LYASRSKRIVFGFFRKGVIYFPLVFHVVTLDIGLTYRTRDEKVTPWHWQNYDFRNVTDCYFDTKIPPSDNSVFCADLGSAGATRVMWVVAVKVKFWIVDIQAPFPYIFNSPVPPAEINTVPDGSTLLWKRSVPPL